MANFEGIRRLSDAQFDTLASGGTVEGESYSANLDYETPVYETEIGNGLKIESDTLKVDTSVVALQTQIPTVEYID